MVRRRNMPGIRVAVESASGMRKVVAMGTFLMEFHQRAKPLDFVVNSGSA